MVRMASHSKRGRIFCRKVGLYSSSRRSNSASWKWSGNEAAEVLHALTAQVRKFTVSNFIVDEQRDMFRTWTSISS